MKRLITTHTNYMNILLEQQEMLTKLVQDQYASEPVELQQIAEYTFEDRGIYHVQFRNGRSYVLRAFRYDIKETLQRQAALLTYLEYLVYPAPRLLHTAFGASVALYKNWMALMVSYVDGALADFSPEHLTLLGACLGALHAQSEYILDSPPSSTFPDSRLHPRQLPIQTSTFPISVKLPEALQKLYEASVATIVTLQQATQLPIVLLHGDCWPHNAVITDDGLITLIDWDCAGLGPAILDVGYLLLTCHLGKPQLPAMHADPILIAAVIRGYYQQRRLTVQELSMMREAVHFETARRVIASGMLTNVVDTWQEDVHIQKELARFIVSDEIAKIAQELVTHELGVYNGE